MKIYSAEYCPCIHESAYGTLSLHKTKEGARKAIDDHKDKKYQRWLKYDKWQREHFGDNYDEFSTKFATHEDWQISELELLE